MPKISVIMGIYNCAATLAEAIECIFAQTFSDWELILCDDGSTDKTLKIARSYADIHPDRIILLRNETNQGLNKTLNLCLAKAKGEYIARMDGDDHCSPNRFEIELAALEAEPEIAFVSTDMTFFDESGVWGQISHPDYPCAQDFIHGSPFCHAPCMVRKKAYDSVGGYSVEKRLLRVEDYHLWLKMYCAGYRGKNIHQPLYQMRDDRNAYGRRKFRFRVNEAYVKALSVRKLNLPAWNYVYVLRPILVGMLPGWLYNKLHKHRLGDK